MCKKSIELRSFEMYRFKEKEKFRKHEKNLDLANCTGVSETPMCIARIKYLKVVIIAFFMN